MPRLQGALSDDARLTSVAYIGPKSRTERPRKTKISTEVGHVARTLRLSCAQPTGNSFTPNQWYRWKAETLKARLLLVWRVCDQAFGRYRPLNGAEKWSRDHHENCKFAYRHM